MSTGTPLNVPKGEGASEYAFYSKDTSFKPSEALASGTWENKWFYEQMDKVIDIILKLQNAGIAATWRPFHEAAGNAIAKQQADWTKAWFWWGMEGAEAYKKLWRTMFDYFKQKYCKGCAETANRKKTRARMYEQRHNT